MRFGIRIRGRWYSQEGHAPLLVVSRHAAYSYPTRAAAESAIPEATRRLGLPSAEGVAESINPDAPLGIYGRVADGWSNE